MSSRLCTVRVGEGSGGKVDVEGMDEGAKSAPSRDGKEALDDLWSEFKLFGTDHEKQIAAIVCKTLNSRRGTRPLRRTLLMR